MIEKMKTHQEEYEYEKMGLQQRERDFQNRDRRVAAHHQKIHERDNALYGTSRNHTKVPTPNGTKQELTTFTDLTNRFILNIKTKIGKKLTSGKLSAKLCSMKLLLLTKEHKLKGRIIIFKSENRY